MKITVIGVVTFVLLLSASEVHSQSQCNQPYTLSEIGKTALQSLQKEPTFALGGVGYAGHTSDGEKAMNVLLDQNSAQEVLFELATKNSGVGGLYGLVGLKIIKSNCFQEGYQQYLKLPDLTELKSTGFEDIPKGYVETMSGCMIGYASRIDLAGEIAGGKMDQLIDHLEKLRMFQKEKLKSEKKNP